MNVFITGGTTGIGYHLANEFLKNGHRVGICGRNLSKVDDQEFKSNENLSMFEVDVLDREKLINVVKEFAGDDLDIMVANAGVGTGSKTKEPDFENFGWVTDINIKGVFNSVEACYQIFKNKKKGHIVGVASVAGFVGTPGASCYCGSKAAVIKILESFACDFKRLNIKVTTICPGFIDTPLTRKNDHDMPFLMSGPKGAKKIYKAIMKQKRIYVFPWQMNLVMIFLRLIPRSLYVNIMNLKFLNYSK